MGIEPRELRIGNWVNSPFYGDFEIVALTIFPGGNNSAFKKTEYYPEAAKISGLKGVSITEEWLLKLGFSKIMTNLFKIEISERTLYVSLSENGDRHFYISNGFNEVVLKRGKLYLHQLQNLYFALTGEEL